MRIGNTIAGATGACALAGFIFLGAIAVCSAEFAWKPPPWSVGVALCLFLPGVCTAGIERIAVRWGLGRKT